MNWARVSSPMIVLFTWPFRIICIYSIPQRDLEAVRQDWKPSAAFVIFLINRWSCSMILFRDLTCRRTVFAGNKLSICKFSIAHDKAGFLSTLMTRKPRVFGWFAFNVFLKHFEFYFLYAQCNVGIVLLMACE